MRLGVWTLAARVGVEGLIRERFIHGLLLHRQPE